MISNRFLNDLIKNQLKISNFVKYSSNSINIEKLEQDSAISNVVDDESIERETQIQQKRNKSRLSDAHRNILHNRKPFNEPQHWSHGTLRYHRKLYGLYGSSSEVNPAYCFPTKFELSETLEYERVKYPFTIKQMMEMNSKIKLETRQKVLKRQQEIGEKVKKLDGWIKEVEAKKAKKEADAKAAKERKDKLIEEVRRHFGFTVDPRDDRFKEMLEKKEKEQKKQMKEAKKKAKETKLLEKLMGEADGGNVEESGVDKKTSVK